MTCAPTWASQSAALCNRPKLALEKGAWLSPGGERRTGPGRWLVTYQDSDPGQQAHHSPIGNIVPSCFVLFQRLKAALTHHPAAMSNGNMNTMGHMMEMMGSRQDQTPHHHMHSHPHQHQTLPAHHPYPHQHQHPAHHPHPQPHHQQNHPHHHSHLHAHPAHHQTSPHPPLHSGNQAQVSPATQQMQPTQTIQPPQPTGGRRRRVVDEDPDERRRKFLERNRAAATRCRQKRKVWVMSLEKKAEELTQTNMQLQVQATVSFLRTQRPCVQLAFPAPAGAC
uniref:cyclic AMP-responsive element-binding protein 5-like n=1 Tax=Panthera onca TaxID=9690 RepID=UPI0029544D92|nr:cyclic AMP-responsive element-binding protein 5-like [Panthera onca]